MKVRACCNNCGFVGDHDVPYRAKITSAFVEDRVVAGESSFTTEQGVTRPLLCTNCGLPHVEIIYWDARGKKVPLGVELSRLVDG